MEQNSGSLTTKPEIGTPAFEFVMDDKNHTLKLKVTRACYEDVKLLLEHKRLKAKKFDIITLGLIWKTLKPHFKELDFGEEDDC